MKRADLLPPIAALLIIAMTSCCSTLTTPDAAVRIDKTTMSDVSASDVSGDSAALASAPVSIEDESDSREPETLNPSASLSHPVVSALSEPIAQYRNSEAYTPPAPTPPARTPLAIENSAETGPSDNKLISGYRAPGASSDGSLHMERIGSPQFVAASIESSPVDEYPDLSYRPVALPDLPADEPPKFTALTAVFRALAINVSVSAALDLALPAPPVRIDTLRVSATGGTTSPVGFGGESESVDESSKSPPSVVDTAGVFEVESEITVVDGAITDNTDTESMDTEGASTTGASDERTLSVAAIEVPLAARIDVESVSTGMSQNPIVSTDGTSGSEPSNLVATEAAPFSELARAAIRLSRVGVTIPVLLPGFGWIYVPEGNIEGYEYTGRELTDDGSLFAFYIEDPGNYALKFQRQDNRSGTYEIVWVDLLGSDAVSAPNRRAIPAAGGRIPRSEGDTSIALIVEPATEMTIENRTVRARTLFGSHRYDESLAEYRTLIGDGARHLFPEAARAASMAGDSSLAVRYYAEAIRDTSGDTKYALLLSALDAAESGGSIEPIRQRLQAILADELLRHREDYQRLGSLLEAESYYVEAAGVYDWLLRAYRGSAGADQILFRLAACYERESPIRDERKAHGIYKEILENYPMSRYYDDAEARVSHIERHFLNIR